MNRQPNPRSGWVLPWLPHLLSLVMPLTALGFVVTGPHPWYVVPLWLIPQATIVLADLYGPRLPGQPRNPAPVWPFDLLLYTQALLQLLVIAGTVWMASRLSFASPAAALDALVNLMGIAWIVGTSSAICSMVGGHELLHRRSPLARNLSRLLLATVGYEHFFTEHRLGHHARVATADDPATARFGETFNDFFLRTVPAQFKSAWRLEKARLGDAAMSNRDPRMIRHRCLQGLVAEIGLVVGVLVLLGPVALLALVLQGVTAVRELEAVNFMEHWGLTRQQARVTEQDSWDCEAASTHYVMFGLARHAAHHARAATPYQELICARESPKLPFGYQAMVLLIEFRPRHFARLMTEELRRTQLGPFRPVSA